jgi:glutathione S-transferase
MSFFVWISQWVTPNYYSLAKSTNKVQIITLAFSHFCEVATWSLKLANIPFREHAYAPGQHVLPAIRVRLGGPSGEKHLSESSRVTSIKECKIRDQASAENGEIDEKTRKYQSNREKSTRATAVPVAILPNGQVLTDSWSIAEYAQSHLSTTCLPPDFKKFLDEEIGPLTRQAAYSIVLKEKNMSIFHELCTINRNWFWRTFWFLIGGNYLEKIMTKLFESRNPKEVEQCRQKLQIAFTKLDEMISSRKFYFYRDETKFLFSDELSIADIALASLVAAVIVPPYYCGGSYDKTFQRFYHEDEEARKEVESWRQTITGQYCMELYTNYRL